MSFYISDDLTEVATLVKENPNARYFGKWCDALAVDELIGDSEKCPVCNRHVSMLKWLEPRKIKLSNTRYPDRLKSWLPQSFVISERSKEAYEQEGLTGIKLFTPVEVVKVSRMKKDSPASFNYFSAEIAYTSNVRVDVANSEIIGQNDDWQCALCNPFGSTRDQIIKISLDASNWQGEDIFKVYSLGVVYSQKFYDLVQKHNLTNFNLVPVSEYQRGLR